MIKCLFILSNPPIAPTPHVNNQTGEGGATVMHPHERMIRPWMTIYLGQRTTGTSSDMRKHKT